MAQFGTDIVEAVFTNLIGQPVKLWDPSSSWKPDLVIKEPEQIKSISFIHQVKEEYRQEILRNLLQSHRIPAVQSQVEVAPKTYNMLVRQERFPSLGRINSYLNLRVLWRDYGTVQISSNETVGDLRAKIEDLTGVPARLQSLWSNNNVYPDDMRTIESLGLEDGSQVELRLRLLGGAATVGLDKNLFDPSYNFDFTSVDDTGNHHQRGGMEYKRPIGWYRFGINVKDKYGDNKWLGMTGKADCGEWAVSYHGTKSLESVGSIIEGGYDPSKTTTNVCKFDKDHKVYSCPFIKVAESYAQKVVTKSGSFLFVFQNRINPKDMQRAGNYWGAGMKTMRPYGLLVKGLDSRSNEQCQITYKQGVNWALK